MARTVSNKHIEKCDTVAFLLSNCHKKQWDKGVQPESRWGIDGWPIVIIEIGYSQTLASLQHDTVTWLDQSSGRIKFVILVRTKRNPLCIRIQCCKICPTGHGWTGQTCSEAPMCYQDFDINYGGVVSSRNKSTELIIPHNCIFDDSAISHYPNILFTLPQLSSIGQAVFRQIE